MDKSILKRLEALENRPEGQIPRLWSVNRLADGLGLAERP